MDRTQGFNIFLYVVFGLTGLYLLYKMYKILPHFYQILRGTVADALTSLIALNSNVTEANIKSSSYCLSPQNPAQMKSSVINKPQTGAGALITQTLNI